MWKADGRPFIWGSQKRYVVKIRKLIARNSVVFKRLNLSVLKKIVVFFYVYDVLVGNTDKIVGKIFSCQNC